MAGLVGRAPAGQVPAAEPTEVGEWACRAEAGAGPDVAALGPPAEQVDGVLAVEDPAVLDVR